MELARELDSINLPTRSDELLRVLECSERSFRGQIRDRSRAVYLFCAEEIATRQVVGASMIIGKHGTPRWPHYYLEIDGEDRYSHTLRKMLRHSYLRLRHSMDGPTELGGLIVAPAMRRHPEKIGKQISWVRFLYLAAHRSRFESRVIAEMLSPLLPDGSNLFWDHYGRRVTGLSFREADRLSIHDKEFIQALFPEAPLYTFLLPDNVRAVLGVAGGQSRGAIRLVEQAGMKFLGHIDPFDAGPYYGAAIAELEPVRTFRSLRAARSPASIRNAAACLIAREDRAHGFRAVKTAACAGQGLVEIPAEVFGRLRIEDNDRVGVVPLP